jgi:hypothetical protein
MWDKDGGEAMSKKSKKKDKKKSKRKEEQSTPGSICVRLRYRPVPNP